MVNVLGKDHGDIALHFRTPMKEDKLTGAHWHEARCSAPTAFSTSKSYLIVGMLVQVILLILVLTEYPFFSYFFKDENAVHKNRIILVKT